MFVPAKPVLSGISRSAHICNCIMCIMNLFQRIPSLKIGPNPRTYPPVGPEGQWPRGVFLAGTATAVCVCSKSIFGCRPRTLFAARRGARGSAPPRREAAAYGVAYLSTKRLGAIKSLSGRAVMFVPAKTFFVRNLELITMVPLVCLVCDANTI